MQNRGSRLDSEQELRDRIKVEDTIKTNLRYMADHAYLSVKPLNFSEHAMHQDLHSFSSASALAQATQVHSSTYWKPKIELL